MIDDELLHKWIDGQLTQEELKIFKQRPEYESLVDLYKRTDHLVEPNVDLEGVLEGIVKQSKASTPLPTKAKTRSLPTFLKYGIAASVLLLAGWFLWPKGSGQVIYELAKGERKEVVLPDQSKVVLNAESRLTYDEQNWTKSRTLNLKGEAFFEVQKGSKFTVQTTNGSVEVLGTKFNVWSRKGALEVKCHSGKVAVSSSSKDVSQELLPDDAIRLESGIVSKKWKIAKSQTPSWTSGVSRFKKVTLSRVLEELERQYKVRVEAPGINTDEIISCHFQHQDLKEALKTILTPLNNIQFELRENNTIVHLFKE